MSRSRQTNSAVVRWVVEAYAKRSTCCHSGEPFGTVGAPAGIDVAAPLGPPVRNSGLLETPLCRR
jgi:hypothetical protein